MWNVFKHGILLFISLFISFVQRCANNHLCTFNINVAISRITKIIVSLNETNQLRFHYWLMSFHKFCYLIINYLLMKWTPLLLFIIIIWSTTNYFMCDRTQPVDAFIVALKFLFVYQIARIVFKEFVCDSCNFVCELELECCKVHLLVINHYFSFYLCIY